MTNKVTSYEISKRLDELGFECDSHCGWWNYYGEGFAPEWTESLYLVDTSADPSNLLAFPEHTAWKAYDCFDLLMWLRDNMENKYQGAHSYIHKVFWIHHDSVGGFAIVDTPIDGYPWGRADEPQNALGLAVIKTLELD
jgi:hypothetical protein